MIDCSPKQQRKYEDGLVYDLGGVAVAKERGKGIPRSDVERLMSHYNIDRATAEYCLNICPIEELLPERGTGLETGMAARLVDEVHIGVVGYDPMVASESKLLAVGQAAKVGHIGSRWFNKAPEGDNLLFGSPVAADGNTIEIEIDGVNDTAVAQQMGMRITVTRPDGTTKVSPLTYEGWPYTGGHGTHHFIFDNFIAIDQEGNYSIKIELWEA